MQYDNKDLIKAKEVAKNYFNIENLKPYQILTIVNILENNRNQLVILPTGAGKSLCFQIPSLLLKGISIIVYPLLSLMHDQEKRFKDSNIKYVSLMGGQTKEQRKIIFNNLNKADVHIVLTNPETLIQEKILNSLKPFNISLLVIDEAHVIYSWGKQFRPAYLKLTEKIYYLHPRQILAFTGTANNATINFLKATLFQGHKPNIIKANANRENIIYNSVYCLSKDYTLRQLLKNCAKPALVFCPTRIFVEYHYCTLKKEGFENVYLYHAKLPKKLKQYVEKQFYYTKSGILFATNAYGMGIDKKNIRTVIHIKLPSNVQAFLQESGRGGRDGKITNSIVLIDYEDLFSKKNDLSQIFTNSTKCRRASLMKLLDQNLEECNGCDVCNKTFSSTIPELKALLMFFKLNPLKFKIEEATLFLIGEITPYSKKSLNPYFGYFNNWRFNELEGAINKLIKYKSLKKAKFSKKKNFVYFPILLKQRTIL